MRTIKEHILSMDREETMNWIKETVAGASLLVFVVASFALIGQIA
jgi:hypothetical protein